MLQRYEQLVSYVSSGEGVYGYYLHFVFSVKIINDVVIKSSKNKKTEQGILRVTLCYTVKKVLQRFTVKYCYIFVSLEQQ